MSNPFNVGHLRPAAMLLMVMCSPLLAQTPSSGPDIYTCTDAQGRKHTSDRKIPECYDREQKILNPNGTFKASIAPPLTAQERSQIEAKNKALELERIRLEEEKKRDRALLLRYPNEALHQKARDTSLTQVMLVKQAAVKRVAELAEERSKLDGEMAFYAKNPGKAPQKLRQQIDGVRQALEAQGRFMVDKDNEITRTNVRFDEEMQRLKPLWQLNAKPAVK